MSARTLVFFAAGLLVISFKAHAQLQTTDQGAAVIDASGLMWANTVGTNLGWSPPGSSDGVEGWIAGLNASHYGGFDDWVLATGDGSVAANSATNQIGQFFYTDCGNVVGTQTVLNNTGHDCTSLSALDSVLQATQGLTVIFSSSPDAALNTPDHPFPSTQFFFWSYIAPASVQAPWTNDTLFNGVVGEGDALAVRRAPEVDPDSAVSALTLLLGSVAVLRGRRRHPA